MSVSLDFASQCETKSGGATGYKPRERAGWLDELRNGHDEVFQISVEEKRIKTPPVIVIRNLDLPNGPDKHPFICVSDP
jgi:hypothetical protein